MSHNHVKIYFGPCDSFHTRTHKPQKLRGLKDRLLKLGFRVDLAPVEYENYCVLEMCGHEIFRCNIQNLSFNTPYEYDVVAQRAVDAVIESKIKFKRARCYLWFWTLLEENMFRSDKFGPKDHWSQPLEFKNLSSCADCIKCCDILVTKKKC